MIPPFVAATQRISARRRGPSRIAISDAMVSNAPTIEASNRIKIVRAVATRITKENGVVNLRTLAQIGAFRTRVGRPIPNFKIRPQAPSTFACILPGTRNLQTPTARARLAPCGKPYSIPLLRGVWLGYRAAQSGEGTWIVIAANGKGGRWTKAFARADDKAAADGIATLDYEQAANRARALAVATAMPRPTGR
jgi:hypothetical protein